MRSVLPLMMLLFSVCVRAECLDMGLTQEIANQFNFEGWDVDQQTDLCNPDSLGRKTFQALKMIRDIPSEFVTKDKFDNGFAGPSMFEFFKERISTIRFDRAKPFSPCSGSTVAYVTSLSGSRMQICPYGNGFSTVLLGSILIHEARHIDGFSHVSCEQGYYAGSMACDRSYAMGGSYGLGLEFQVRIARSEKASPELRQAARGTAIADFITRFNEKPLEMEFGLLIQSEDGDLDYFDGSKFTTFSKGIGSNVIVAQRDLPTFFDLSDGSVTTKIDDVLRFDGVGPFAQSFRNLLPEERARIIDVYFGDVACWLKTDQIYCTRGLETAVLPMPEGRKAIRILSMNSFLTEMAYVVMNDGSLFLIPQKTHLRKWNSESWVEESIETLKGLKGFGVLPKGQRYSISLDGQLQTAATSQPWKPFMGQEHRRFKKILRPMLWSPKLDEL